MGSFYILGNSRLLTNALMFVCNPALSFYLCLGESLLLRASHIDAQISQCEKYTLELSVAIPVILSVLIQVFQP